MSLNGLEKESAKLKTLHAACDSGLDDQRERLPTAIGLPIGGHGAKELPVCLGSLTMGRSGRCSYRAWQRRTSHGDSIDNEATRT